MVSLRWLVAFMLVLRWLPVWALGTAPAPEPTLPQVASTSPASLQDSSLDRVAVEGDDDGDDDGGKGGGHDGGDDDGDDDHDGGDDDHDGDEDEKDHPPDDHGDDDHDGEDGAYDAAYSYFGQVRWSGERTIVGSRELVGDDPWLRYLAPGMRLEVKGEVQGSRIRVSRIEVKYPAAWAYYAGPARVIGLGGGWVRAWLSGSGGRNLFKLLPATGETAPLLVACYERGRWRSLPLGLRPDARPPEDGWWRLTGSLSGSGVAWTLAGRLPGDCD